MKSLCPIVLVSLVLASPPSYAGVTDIDWDSTPLVQHSEFNAVDSTGSFTFNGSFPLRLRGVLLNNPEDMLNATPFSPNPVPFNLGASWQVYIQAVDGEDFGGTAVFMGQHYGNVPPNLTFTPAPTPDPSRSYTDLEWDAEMDRVNHDRATEHVFRAGDLVEIHAQERRFYGGKLNVNENHIKEDIADFELTLIQANYGLPTPTSLELADIWTGSPTTGGVTFDPSRATGGEHYQGSLVRLHNVKIAGGDAWGPDADLQVQDAEGRQFTVKLGLSGEFANLMAPTGYINLTGIFDQEDANDAFYTGNYRLWVMDASTITLSGDFNSDGVVDAADYTVWRDTYNSTDDLRADADSSGVVDDADYNIWSAGFGSMLSLAEGAGAAVPEPATLVQLTFLASLFVGLRRNA